MMQMKKLTVLLLAFVMAIPAFSQQFNDANAVKRDVKGYHALKVSHGIKVYLSQGSEESVAVSADEAAYRDRIITEVVNGVLVIRFDNDNWKVWKSFGGKNLRAYVSAKQIDGLDISSGAHVKIDGTLRSGMLDLDASSGAVLEGAVDIADMKADMSSGAVVTISGKVTRKLKVDGSSGSIFKGFDLITENCDAGTSSGAGVQITVNKELSVDASSGGYIRYKGEGLIRDVKTSSGGSVSRKS